MVLMFKVEQQSFRKLSERISPCKSFKLDENLEQFRLEIGLTLLLLQFDAANGFAELDQKPKVFFFSSY